MAEGAQMRQTARLQARKAMKIIEYSIPLTDPFTAMRASKFSSFLLCVWVAVSAVVIGLRIRLGRRLFLFLLIAFVYFVVGGTDLLAGLNFTADYNVELRTHHREAVHSQVIQGSVSFGEDGWLIMSNYEDQGTNSPSSGMEMVSWKQHGTFWNMVVAAPGLSNAASAAAAYRDDFPYLPSAIDGALWLGYCSFNSDTVHSADGYVPVPTDGPISQPIAHTCRMEAEWFPGKLGLLRSATFVTDKDRIASAHENPMLRREVFVKGERRRMLTPLKGRIVPNVTRLEYATSATTTNNGVTIPLQFRVRAFRIRVNRNPDNVEGEARLAWEMDGRLSSLKQTGELLKVPAPKTGKESVWIADYRLPDNKYAISQVTYEVPYGEFPLSNAPVVVEAFDLKLQQAKEQARARFVKRLGFYALMLIVMCVPIWFLFRNHNVKNKLARA